MANSKNTYKAAPKKKATEITPFEGVKEFTIVKDGNFIKKGVKKSLAYSTALVFRKKGLI